MFTILQICDSAFPTGGFSHSLGAEANTRNGLLKDKDDLIAFVRGTLENLGSLGLPFVKAAHACKNEDKLIVLDLLLNAMLTNHVTRRASIQQGETLLCTASGAFDLPHLEHLQDGIENRKLYGHQAIIFGVLCASLNISAEDCAKMYMFIGLRTITASLVRLGKIGAIEELEQRARGGYNPISYAGCVANVPRYNVL